ncbi:MAG: sigma 54-interacting transcriptional regulator [Desulfosalsimonadaceae bacterium]
MHEKDLNLYWKTVVDTIKDGVMIVDKRGVIVSVNRAMSEITGYERDELLGKPCTFLNCSMCDTVLEKSGEHWCLLFRTGYLNMREAVIQKKNTEIIPVLKNASLLRDGEDHVIGAVETITDITELNEKETQISALRSELLSENSFHGLLGDSLPMQQVYDLIENAACSDAPVIIFGESGTGKELVAQAIHNISRRSDNFYIKVNCAALNDSLLESELFGHRKGSFTGAYQDRTGRFEAAKDGTIFLDEIGDLPLSTQVKLLRVLEDQVIERVGDNQPRKIDVRIITATNRDLQQLMETGRFRDDLFYRINVIPIRVPPLRKRGGDISLLADAFFQRNRLKSDKPVKGISNAAMEALVHYSWPGNVRELKSAFEYAFVTCDEPMIRPEHLPPDILNAGKTKNGGREKSTLNREEAKKQQLIDALREAAGNQSRAAEILGVSRVTVWNRIKRYGISVHRDVVENG